MKIGIDASRANKFDKTGTEWYAFNLIQEFKKISETKDQFILYSKEELTGELANLPINFKSKVLKWPPVFLWTQLRLAWEMLWHAPDALFVPAHTVPIICPKNTFTTLHDVGFEGNKQLYSKKNIGPKNKIVQLFLKILLFIFTFGKYSNNEYDYHRWSTRLALKKSKKIFTVSNFSKQEINKFFSVGRGKIIVVYNGFNENFKIIDDQNKVERILKEFNIEKPFLYFIGRLENKKNIDKLIEAYLKYKKNYNHSIKLVLVGRPGFGYGKIKSYLENNQNEITNINYVSPEKLPYLMNAAEILLFPSNYEGFGIPIIEAMACGTPVITSNFGAMKEVGGKAAYFVNPTASGSITSAIDKLLKDKELRANLIEQGLKRAAGFSWAKTAAIILQNIKE